MKTETAVMFYNIVMLVVFGAVWWKVYEATGSNWSFLVFLIASTFQMTWRTTANGEQEE